MKPPKGEAQEEMSMQFEIHVMREKRWIIETVVKDESDAQLMAINFLKQESCEEVKIFKQTKGITGLTREKEIFYKTRDDNKKAPLQLSGRAEDAALCQGLPDCYQLPARLSIQKILRQYLDKFQITATELLHSATFLRKLADSDSLLGAAIHQVGMAQAGKAKVEPKQRSQQLQTFFVQVLERAKDYTVDRKSFSGLRDDDYDYSYRRLRALSGDKADYNFLSHLSLHFANEPSRAVKRAALIAAWDKAEETKVIELLDGMIADHLAFPETIEELFGRHPSFLVFLKQIIDLLHGRLETTQSELQSVSQKIYDDKAPQCRTVLVDRLLREMESEKPLDRRDIEAEDRLIKTLESYLNHESGGLLGNDAAAKALSERRLRERKRKLRAAGLHDAADAL